MSDGGRPDVDGQSVSHREEAPSLQMNHVPISLQRRRSLSCFHTTSPPGRHVNDGGETQVTLQHLGGCSIPPQPKQRNAARGRRTRTNGDEHDNAFLISAARVHG